MSYAVQMLPYKVIDTLHYSWSQWQCLLLQLYAHRTDCINRFTVCPWVSQYSNNWSFEDQVREVNIPDVRPSDLPTIGHFSMAAGDFLQVYKEEGVPLVLSLYQTLMHMVAVTIPCDSP